MLGVAAARPADAIENTRPKMSEGLQHAPGRVQAQATYGWVVLASAKAALHGCIEIAETDLMAAH